MGFTVLKIIVGLLILFAMFVIANWIFKSRTMAFEDDLQVLDDLSEFRRMRDEGQIDEEEFRRLKKAITKQSVNKTVSKEQKIE